MITRILVLLVCLCSAIHHSQAQQLDSLFNTASTQQGAERAITLTLIAGEVMYDSIERSELYIKQAFELSILADDQSALAASWIAQGNHQLVNGAPGEALKSYQQGLAIYTELGDKKGMGSGYIGVAGAKIDLGEFGEGIENSLKAIPLYEEVGYLEGQASALSQIGVAYYYQENYAKAIEYMKKCIVIDSTMNNMSGLGYSYSNIGSFYYMLDENEKAIAYHGRALEIRRDLGTKLDIAKTLNNIGNVYHEQKNWEQASQYYEEALAIKRDIGNVHEVAITLTNLGSGYKDNNQYEKAIELLEEARSIYDTLNDARNFIIDNLLALSQSYAGNGNFEKAYELREMQARLQDEELKEERDNKFAEVMTKYETEKTERELQTALKEKAEQDKDILESENRQNLLWGSIIIVLLIAGFIYYRYRAKLTTNRQLTQVNHDLEMHGQELAQKNKEITDSINYAKQIQESVLPDSQAMNASLPSHFVLYMPRDIVSGDFYWFHVKDDAVFIAVADCTGHGVPGAFLSMMCKNLLSEAVIEKDINEPGEILTEVNRNLIFRMKAEMSKKQIRDGMDIALCRLSKDFKSLSFAGAKNPLIMVRDGSLTQIKGDRRAIGGITNADFTFATHNIELQQDDTFFLYSDGFQDQFGGTEGKKYLVKRFRDLLLNAASKPIDQLESELTKHFHDWKGTHEQIDDVCIIGVRV